MSGNSISNRVSRVIFNPALQEGDHAGTGSLIIECNPQHLRDLQAKANMRIEIDPRRHWRPTSSKQD